jgi:ABC-type Fe3+-hydroxamate transport system, periplasmic component
MRLIAALLLSAVALPGRSAAHRLGLACRHRNSVRAGLGDRVVGVTDYCKYPPEATKKAKIGGYLRPSLETILALRPDLVIAERSPSNLAAQLARLKITAVEVEYKTLPEILQSIEKIAAAAGVAERGVALRNSISLKMDQIRTRVKPYPRTKVMFVVGRTAGTLTGLIVVGSGSYLTALMEAGGGVNAFADASGAYPKVTMEEVLARDPDVILDRADMGNQSAATEAQKLAVVNLWRTYPMLKAVKQQRVVIMVPDIFFVPGPRIIEAAQAFANMFTPR